MILGRVLLVPFVILVLVCGTLVYFFATYSRDQVTAEMVRIASDHRRLIDQFFRERVADLSFIARSYSFNDLCDQKKLSEVFHGLQLGSKAFFDLGVFDEQGNHRAYIGPYDLAGRNYAETEWFLAVQNMGLYISDEFLGYRNIPHFIMAIRRDEGNHTWYLRASIDTLYFNDLVESIRRGKTGEAYLVNEEGVFQTRRRSGGTLMDPDPDFNSYRVDRKEIISFSLGKSFSGRHLYATGLLEQTDWVLVVRQEMGDAYARLTRAILIAVILIIGGGTIVVVMAYILASGLASRLVLADMEKRQMKTQLIIAGKLAEVGEMSSGLAHEINNPLQVMKSEQTMIEDIISDMEKAGEAGSAENMNLLKDSVNQIGLQIERCRNITQGLLRFARETETQMQPVRMQEFLPEMVNMVEQRARIENIRIIQELDPDLPPIISDANQLQQVFLNLLNNAIYALQETDSAEIRIKTCLENSDILISVADNGHGIPPEDMEKIFVPFFTTKPVGQGTGLGLSTVYGIVTGLGGDVTVVSELQAGTIFTVRLPLERPPDDKNIY